MRIILIHSTAHFSEIYLFSALIFLKLRSVCSSSEVNGSLAASLVLRSQPTILFQLRLSQNSRELAKRDYCQFTAIALYMCDYVFIVTVLIADLEASSCVHVPVDLRGTLELLFVFVTCYSHGARTKWQSGYATLLS